MVRVGRRPGDADTRGVIIEAARGEFLERGYAAATLRAIARRAGVDPALLYHYFGDKAGLFVASLELPMDPRQVKDTAGRGGGSVGVRIVAGFLRQWESDPERPGQSFVAMAQAVCASPEAARSLREFLADRVGGGPGSTHALVASQLVGIAWARYVLQIEPVASASIAEVAALVGPTIDRYIDSAS